MITLTRQHLTALAPHPLSVYLQAFDLAESVLPAYLINATGLRLAHFMAQVLHETGKLTILTESMNYSPEGLYGTFGESRISLEQAKKFGRNMDHPADQRAIANIVYGGEFGRKNLGNTQPDDGWNFRGTGLLQMTGRDARTRIGARLGVDLVNHPENAVDPKYLLKIACEEWAEKSCNVLADRDDIEGVTRRINGGSIGLPERKALLRKTKQVFGVVG